METAAATWDGGCPPASVLAGFVAGGAGDASVEAHLDVCGACRAAVSYAVKGCAGEMKMGRYRLGSVIGAGGMGVVYRAKDPQLGRDVAVKVVSGGGREARNLARVTHENVCRVYDSGVEGEDVWIAMELVEGVTMRAWWGAEERTREDLVRVLVCAANGIAAAHRAGVVHRDVKPENVLIARDGRVVVTDFGLAKAEVAVATTVENVDDGGGEARRVIAGTPAYMAPEQLTGDEVDARADQFAWAVMAWEALRGARPWPIAPGERIAAVRKGISARDEIERVLVRAMKEAKGERWRDMEEVVGEIERASAPRRGGTMMMTAIGALVVGVGGAVMAIAAPGSSPSPSPSRSTTTVERSTITSTSTVDAEVVDAGVVDAGVIDARVKIDARVRIDAGRPVDPIFGGIKIERAEATIATECGMPVDPTDVEGVKVPVADWGRVKRWEEVEVEVGARTMKKVLMEVKGARRSYVLDAGAHDQTLGTLDAAVGEMVVVCPGDDVDIYRLPAGWGTVINAALGYARVPRAPRVPAKQVKKVTGVGREMIWDGKWQVYEDGKVVETRDSLLR